MTRMPSDEDIGTAIAWLECNEGDGGEVEACQRVADYLQDRMIDRAIGREARRAGVSPKDLRRKLKELNP